MPGMEHIALLGFSVDFNDVKTWNYAATVSSSLHLLLVFSFDFVWEDFVVQLSQVTLLGIRRIGFKNPFTMRLRLKKVKLMQWIS